MAHGTFDRARGVPTMGQGWRMPCGGLHRLPRSDLSPTRYLYDLPEMRTP